MVPMASIPVSDASSFGIPDELASDGGPEFTAVATRQFLKDWGVHHRLSSVAYPYIAATAVQRSESRL